MQRYALSRKLPAPGRLPCGRGLPAVAMASAPQGHFLAQP